MRDPLRVVLFVLALSLACAQTQPDVAEILKKVSETYKGASQYEFVADLTAHDPATNKNTSGRRRFAFRAPNKYRMEEQNPGLRPRDTALGDVVIVHDGLTLWFYLPESNQYSSIPADKLTANAPGDLGDVRPESMDFVMMWRFRGAADLTGNSKFLREEAIELGGTRVSCYVVTVSPRETGGLVYTWWVDKTSFRVLREDDAGDSVVFKTIRLNEPLSDDLFKFDPPPGARKIDQPQ